MVNQRTTETVFPGIDSPDGLIALTLYLSAMLFGVILICSRLVPSGLYLFGWFVNFASPALPVLSEHSESKEAESKLARLRRGPA